MIVSLKYYQHALEHLKAHDMAFCYGEDGEFLTREGCIKQIKEFKEYEKI